MNTKCTGSRILTNNTLGMCWDRVVVILQYVPNIIAIKHTNKYKEKLVDLQSVGDEVIKKEGWITTVVFILLETMIPIGYTQENILYTNSYLDCPTKNYIS